MTSSKRFNPYDPCSRWAYLPPKRREEVIDVISSHAKFLEDEPSDDLDFVQVPDIWKAVDALRRLGKLGANPYPEYDEFMEMLDALNGACNIWMRDNHSCEGCILHQVGEEHCWLGAVNDAIENPDKPRAGRGR